MRLGEIWIFIFLCISSVPTIPKHDITTLIYELKYHPHPIEFLKKIETNQELETWKSDFITKLKSHLLQSSLDTPQENSLLHHLSLHSPFLQSVVQTHTLGNPNPSLETLQLLAFKHPLDRNADLAMSLWMSSSDKSYSKSFIRHVWNQFQEAKMHILRDKSQIKGLKFPIEIELFSHSFILDACVGSGSFGIVYRALDKEKNTLAIKFLSSLNLNQFLREVDVLKVMGRLKDKDIRNYVFAQEYVPGESLITVMASNYYNLDLVYDLTMKFKNLVTQFSLKKYKDEQENTIERLIHGDPAPRNVLVKPNGDLEWVDFGKTFQGSKDNIEFKKQLFHERKLGQTALEYLIESIDLAYIKDLNAIRLSEIPLEERQQYYDAYMALGQQFLETTGFIHGNIRPEYALITPDKSLVLIHFDSIRHAPKDVMKRDELMSNQRKFALEKFNKL